MNRFKIYLISLLALTVSCKEKYLPTLETTNTSILVVEGFINLGPDSTIFKLSRTVAVDGKNTANPELDASVHIEAASGGSVVLSNLGKGMYGKPSLAMPVNGKYRLRILTKGSEYLSDFVEAKSSSVLDSVNYAIKPDGLDLFVNAHDATNASHYYRWEYEETWIFYAMYNSQFKWRGGTTVTPRQPDEAIWQCWGNAKSSIILTGNSTKLDKDLINKQPILFIPSNSEKVTEKYSILVKQYSLTKEAYDFWENLKKNTETLGSIFDALPSEITGNIKCISNSEEPVVGFISAGTVQSKRIYITKDKFPTWRPRYPVDCIEPDTAFFWKMPNHFVDNINIPIDEVYVANGKVLLGYRSAGKVCVDCTLRGTNKRPLFWQ